MSDGPFISDISSHIWDTRYRYRESGKTIDLNVEDTWRRVASALAGMERRDKAIWEQRFYQILESFRFLPGGRILAGAGTSHRVTLFNCFVMGEVEDSLDGIFEALKEGALTMQQGGGVGYDFSTLRPSGEPARGVGVTASGPVSFMRIWDSMCATILSTGARRGAMMATLRCDHPDIEIFIAAKRDPGALRHFNLSVLVTDDFMRAVREGADWPLVFPLSGDESIGEVVERTWSGSGKPRRCKVLRRVGARALWGKIMRATYDYAEPGVIFIDRVNRMNNLWYCEQISATNPCGEIPLPHYGACNLGAINLTQFVRRPFMVDGDLDLERISATVGTAVRLLDNVYDLSHFPLQKQAHTACASRRIGLGLTGLADALVMLGIRYGSPQSFALGEKVMEMICHSAYRASIDLAREKGAFPAFQADPYLAGEFIRSLPVDIVQGIRRHGLRNSHLTAIAPTGTISLLANNVSSGLEPIFDWEYTRRIRGADGGLSEVNLADYACRQFRLQYGEDASLPKAFVRADEIAPEAHIRMQAALQSHVDSAISKTINVPAEFDFDAFRSIYEMAYDMGLKGCTVFRPNPVTGQVLHANGGSVEKQCCSIEREAD
ncbi:ribonucleoside-diphosphate reductase, adenosylcobalamin-dependent [Sulfuricella denitrificans skB26]|uniref:Vitamin B12-dependent ribonucleotide reductase n=1 Tax=Sulfuricella denitrificans (strain DSM 22764 / NBRC 105220 / skB26) TaxID=1163617 RepID=S6AGD3_SULDS|nr:adenosylcobalamin-dependent ribonucleoside-diphosphate reductase [Sulfuricella denitrificans]BAN35071.1 ribonucleoside-diphosphate reductase, adenosylcobalamin-dependent [Sulfuricella denitrificans skB26]